MLRAQLRLLLFATGLLIGVQVPGFVHQYQVVVNAHLVEARRALEPFEAIAGRHFRGDLHALIAHYRINADRVIGETGDGVAALVARVAHLEAERAALAMPWYARTWHVAAAADRALLREAAAGYDYRVSLQPAAAAWGLGAGLLLSLLADLTLTAVARALRRKPLLR